MPKSTLERCLAFLIQEQNRGMLDQIDLLEPLLVGKISKGRAHLVKSVLRALGDQIGRHIKESEKLLKKRLNKCDDKQTHKTVKKYATDLNKLNGAYKGFLWSWTRDRDMVEENAWFIAETRQMVEVINQRIQREETILFPKLFSDNLSDHFEPLDPWESGELRASRLNTQSRRAYKRLGVGLEGAISTAVGPDDAISTQQSMLGYAILEQVREIKVLRNFNIDEDTWKRLQVFISDHYQPGETLYKAGDRTDAFHVVLKGVVDLFSPGSRACHIGRLGPGSVLGEVPFLSPLGCPHDALAASEMMMIRVDRPTFEAFSKSQRSRVQAQLTGVLIERLVEAQEHIVALKDRFG
ncbi:MAG: cyclic nucleotide-binding domain-containing protein [Magnetococcales bacterium]|nr:cyclic nucleotide-binding domain-containing protein [Magnetococcales bacterium]